MMHLRFLKPVVGVMISFGVISTAFSVGAREPLTAEDIVDRISRAQEVLVEGRAGLSTATSLEAVEIDRMLDEIQSVLEHAQQAAGADNFADAAATMSVVYGLTNAAIGKLPKTSSLNVNDVTAVTNEIHDQQAELLGQGLDVQDLEYVREFVNNMAMSRAADIESLGLGQIANNAMEGMKNGGFDVAHLKSTLNDVSVDIDSVQDSIQIDVTSFESFSRSLSQVLNDPSALNNFSFALGDAVKDLGGTLQDLATTVASVISSGVDVDLEAAAQGAGFSSFAEAVDAYNAANGTSYSVDEAAAALGK